MTAAPARANSEVKNAMLPRFLATWVAPFRSSNLEKVNFLRQNPQEGPALTVVKHEGD